MKKIVVRVNIVPLRQAFEATGWSQLKLAKRARISQPVVSNTLSGKTLSRGAIVKLSKILGVDVRTVINVSAS